MSRHLSTAETCVLVLLGLVGITANLFTVLHLQSSDICAADFLAFYSGGKLAGSENLYVPDSAMAVQQQHAGCATYTSVFIRPPFFALLLRPFAQFPFQTAFLLWRLAGALAIAACIFLWRAPKRWSLLACGASAALAYNLTNGQDLAFILLWLAVSAWLLERRKYFFAGLVLSLCAAKIHLFLLLPLFIAGRRFWRLGMGVLAGGVALAAISVAVAGWNWPARFLRAAADSRADVQPWAMVNLRGLLYGLPGAGAIEMLLALLVAAAAWYVIRCGSQRDAWAAMVVGGLLVSHHAYRPDAALLIPIGLMIALGSRPVWVKALAIITLLPMTYTLTSTSGFLRIPQLAILGLFSGLALTVRPELKPGFQTWAGRLVCRMRHKFHVTSAAYQ